MGHDKRRIAVLEIGRYESQLRPFDERFTFSVGQFTIMNSGVQVCSLVFLSRASSLVKKRNKEAKGGAKNERV